MAQSLTVWNGLTKAVEKDKSIADIVVRAKAPSEAWKILKSMVEGDNSDRAKEQVTKNFEGLSMDSAESMEEYIARAKSLALNVQYHDVEVTDQEISRRVLNGLPPPYAPEKRNFALKTDFSLAELEGHPIPPPSQEFPPPQEHVRDWFKFKCSGSCYSTGTDSLSPSQFCVGESSVRRENPQARV